jgi:hypothetical protein
MAVGYLIVSVVIAAATVGLLWPVNPLLAVAASPFAASGAVLVAAVWIAARRPIFGREIDIPQGPVTGTTAETRFDRAVALMQRRSHAAIAPLPRSGTGAACNGRRGGRARSTHRLCGR